MLPYVIAVHPGTSPDVLTVLAACDHPYAATIARLRLGIDLLASTSHVGLTTADLAAILHRPGITSEQRRTITCALPAQAWDSYLQTPLPTGDDLTALADCPQEVGGGVRATRWTSLIAAHPNTPHDVAVRMLDHAIRLERIAPAVVLAIMDTHGITPTELGALNRISASAVSHQTTIRDTVDKYQRAGGLLRYMTTAPAVASNSERAVSWLDVLAVTSSTELVTSFLEHGQLTRAALRALWCNSALPASTYTLLGQRVHARLPAHGYSSTLNDLTKTLTAHPDPGSGPLLDALVRRAADTPRLIPTIAGHPHLPPAHLVALAKYLPSTLGTPVATQVAAMIATHPNTTGRARSLARAALPDISHLDGHPLAPLTRAHLATATGSSPHVADLPEDPTESTLPNPGALVTPALRTHPELLTHTDLVRAVLTLLPGFDGTVDQLLTAATTIISRP